MLLIFSSNCQCPVFPQTPAPSARNCLQGQGAQHTKSLHCTESNCKLLSEPSPMFVCLFVLAVFFLCATYSIFQILQIPRSAKNTILSRKSSFHNFNFFCLDCGQPWKTPVHPLWPNSNVTSSSWPQSSLWPHNKTYTPLLKHKLPLSTLQALQQLSAHTVPNVIPILTYCALCVIHFWASAYFLFSSRKTSSSLLSTSHSPSKLLQVCQTSV